MNILENVSLANYSTMRLGGKTRYFAEAASEREIVEMVNWANAKQLDCLVIGGGSNIVWRDEGFSGLVILNKIKGIEILAEDETGAALHVGAGEVWDKVVAFSVDRNLTGIEFLSAIPGSAGAGPVQNIGAYGAEIADTLVEVTAYDRQREIFATIPASDCDFGYRTSRFKTTDKGRFIITDLVLKLEKANPKPPFYESLQKYFDEHDTHDCTPAIIRQAVITIRAVKLPDPSVVANNGSFFTNPIIEQAEFKELKSKYPGIKGWPASEGRVKIAAGWLVEQAGFRGVHDQRSGMATWQENSLVLVNEHAASTADLLAFKQTICDKVAEMFGITLEQEPELLP